PAARRGGSAGAVAQAMSAAAPDQAVIQLRSGFRDRFMFRPRWKISLSVVDLRRKSLYRFPACASITRFLAWLAAPAGTACACRQRSRNRAVATINAGSECGDDSVGILLRK